MPRRESTGHALRDGVSEGGERIERATRGGEGSKMKGRGSDEDGGSSGQSAINQQDSQNAVFRATEAANSSKSGGNSKTGGQKRAGDDTAPISRQQQLYCRRVEAAK